MKCISDNDLAALLEGSLAPDRQADVLAELAQCDACREVARAWATSSSGFADGTPTSLAAPAPGTEIGPFRLDALIGAGAMGLVFRAHDPALARDVAVKLVAASDADARARALEEARLLATVRHPNVVAVHAAGSAAGLAYLAMELVDGDSLDRRLVAGPVPWRQAVRWFGGAARGLAAAHAVGVIHRDVKPANLLIDGDRLRLADFGLAVTSAEPPAGTRAYAAPEVLTGSAATAASDQYGLFVALHETLTGARPIDHTAARTIRPAGLRRLVARGLDPDPRRRWPDLEGAAAALAAIERPRRWTWIAAALATALIAGWAIARVRPRAATCVAPAVAWPAPPADDLASHAALAQLGRRWAEAYLDTCGAPRATARRACLARVQHQITTVVSLAETATPAARLRALLEVPGPGGCRLDDDGGGPADPRWPDIEAARALGRLAAAAAMLPSPDLDDAAMARLRGTIAHQRLDLPAAEQALRRAITLAAQGDQPAVAIDAQLELGLVVGYDQDRHEAGAAYVEAARASAAARGDRRRVALADSAAGLIAGARGDVDAAVTALTRAIDGLAAAEATVLERADAERRLGWVLREAGDAGAVTHLERARALRVDALGADHPAVAEVDIELAMVEARTGHADHAISRYREVLGRLTEDDLPTRQRALAALGAAQLTTGAYADAEASFAACLALRRQVLGERHVDVARAQVNLATVYYYQGRYADAVSAYRAAGALARSLLGGDHPEVATIASGLALALQAAGQLAEAHAAITEAVAIYRARPGHDAALADVLMTQGLVELATDDLPAAQASLDESLAITRQVHGPDDVALAPVLSLLGELALQRGQLARAAEVVTTARQLRLDHGVAPQLVAENEFVLALVAWRQGQRPQARTLARSARDRLGDARPDLAAQIDAWAAAHGAARTR
ncbi:MAG: serine/threonine-protein kinase [Kofleriaceae bacterium]